MLGSVQTVRKGAYLRVHVTLWSVLLPFVPILRHVKGNMEFASLDPGEVQDVGV